MSSTELIAAVRGAFGDRILDSHEHCGDATVVIERDQALDILRELRDGPEFQFNFLIDVTAVDYLGKTPRFEVVYHLFSLPKNRRLRVKIGVSEEERQQPDGQRENEGRAQVSPHEIGRRDYNPVHGLLKASGRLPGTLL